MRYHALKAEGVIGSGVVEAANKTLVTQRMKRSGMRWRMRTFRALIESARLRAWKAIMRPTTTSSLCRHRHRCLNSMNEGYQCESTRGRVR